jgi:hypothetical protein
MELQQYGLDGLKTLSLPALKYL